MYQDLGQTCQSGGTWTTCVPFEFFWQPMKFCRWLKTAQRLRFGNTDIQLGTVARSVTRLMGEFCLCNFVAWLRNKEVSSDSCVT